MLEDITYCAKKLLTVASVNRYSNGIDINLIGRITEGVFRMWKWQVGVRVAQEIVRVFSCDIIESAHLPRGIVRSERS